LCKFSFLIKKKIIVCVLCALNLTRIESTGSKEANEKTRRKITLTKLFLISFNQKRINKSKKKKKIKVDIHKIPLK
jgi:hypothetical protein